MTFGEWLESERMTGNTDTEYLSAWLGWTAGQKAEREKYPELIAAAEAIVMTQDIYGGIPTKMVDHLRDLIERMKNDDR